MTLVKNEKGMRMFQTKNKETKFFFHSIEVFFERSSLIVSFFEKRDKEDSFCNSCSSRNLPITLQNPL
jgi:hypothetical protein